jgi:predicted Abi (CAAX) family protease
MAAGGLARAAWRRLAGGLTTWPDGAGWAFSAAAGVVTAGAMAGLGFASGLYHLAHADLEGLPARAALAFVTPALGEETLFRGLMIPSIAVRPRPWTELGVTTAIFVAWRLVEAAVILPQARWLFLRPDFLCCAGVLGLGCGLMRWRTSSLGPGVALHWAVVVVWQTWLGGPALEALS